MGAYDTSFKPQSVTPANTSEQSMFTVGAGDIPAADVQCLIDVTIITGATPDIRVGIRPNGGGTFWKLHDVPVTPGNPLLGIGPWFLQDGDAIRVQTDDADEVTFSATGTYTT